MEVKTHSCQPDVATGKSKSEGNNESEGDFHNTGQIILLIRSYKEAPVSFGTILSVYIVLIVIGIFVNGAVSLVMLRGKRFKKNASNFFIFSYNFHRACHSPGSLSTLATFSTFNRRNRNLPVQDFNIVFEHLLFGHFC